LCLTIAVPDLRLPDAARTPSIRSANYNGKGDLAPNRAGIYSMNPAAICYT